jgi:hypothetical protein
MMIQQLGNSKGRARKSSSPQSGPPDALEQLARISALILIALDRLEEHQAAASKDRDVGLETGLQLRHTELEDRRKSIEQEASFLLAQSATGALFQAMVASNEVHSLGASTLEEAERHAMERRIQRYLFSVVQFLSTLGADRMERVRQYYAPSHLDPLAALDDAIGKELGESRSYHRLRGTGSAAGIRNASVGGVPQK